MLRRMVIFGSVLLLLNGGWAVAKDKSERDSESAWVGVYLGEVPQSLSVQLALGDQGVLLSKIIDDSPAEQAGLKSYDVVTSVDGQAVEDTEGFVELIQKKKSGEVATLELIRGGQKMSVPVTLGVRPDDFEIDFDFDFDVDFDSGAIPGGMWWLRHGGDGELGEKLEDALEGLESGKVKVEVQCEDGQGTMTIERDGQTSTESFDCDHEGKGKRFYMFKHRLGDESDVHAALELDHMIQLPHVMKRLKGLRLEESSGTKFRVEGGRIEVTVRKDGSELTEVYLNEEELAQKNPKLYEEYLLLKEETKK